MEYVTRIRDTSFIACTKCQYALLPSSLNSHFKTAPHRLSHQIRQDIDREIREWPNLVLNNQDILSKLQELSTSTIPKSFSELTLYRDGLGCHEHSYIVRDRATIQKHYRDYHLWINPRSRGQRIKNDEVPWEIEILCQQFFHTSPGKEYFRVRVDSSPTLSIRPQGCARSENESDRNDENDESSSNEDIDQPTIPQGNPKRDLYI